MFSGKTEELIRRLKRDNPDIEKSIFNSIHSVCLDTFAGYKTGGTAYSFLENYDRRGQTPAGLE